MLVGLLLLVVVRGEAAANGTVLVDERSASCWFFGLFRTCRPLELLLLERPETGKHASKTVVAMNASTILCLMIDGWMVY